ncbi:MAG: type II secretion system protein M [Deltaproteobacteria bacterium]|nr:MAG: type II secretion system protein M [Deltaproteobacteria bacterium]
MAIKLSKREKYAIWVASALIGLFAITQLIVVPLLDKRNRLIRGIQVQTEAYQDMLKLKNEYETLKKRADTATKSITAREKGFTLFSFLDQLAGQAGLKDNIAYMKPSMSVQENSPYKTSVVETKLQTVTLERLTAYIYMIETSRNMVKLKKLSISKKGQQAGYVDAVLLAETLEL